MYLGSVQGIMPCYVRSSSVVQTINIAVYSGLVAVALTPGKHITDSVLADGRLSPIMVDSEEKRLAPKSYALMVAMPSVARKQGRGGNINLKSSLKESTTHRVPYK
ncbi:hypothetical protein LIER_33655 [Lithospermum erythrorhizon]|uniref:Uncharacterized protein n=1 Tax=Lithospermum erythrorhizon TaxID=34254 RepID=A0AAV3RYS0_LITER